ncbi:hypothetical protein [Rathayibacter soli]|uniref:hypothetical protein n=1 Tax=Rathayibacter soli TaxID=3144168 RepID=UPI0027E4833E|nr:hypothetical protein [Glaciibacter superstes]
MSLTVNQPEPGPSKFHGPTFLRLDLPGRGTQPALWRWAVATIVAIGLSLLACAGLAAIAAHLLPAIAGYGHFQFADYSKLTIIGVFTACIGWLFVTWITTSGRRLYLAFGVLATIVSLAPDLWIPHLGQPPAGVTTLAVMHIALGVITYPSMVLIAPQRTPQPNRRQPNQERAANVF